MAEHSPAIFISYAREDTRAAERLCEDLKSVGTNVWFDKEALLPGQKWKVAIKQAIRSCHYFLAVLSKNSVTKRGYVQKEVSEALDIVDEFPDSKIFLIPIRLDECEPSHEKLNDFHWVDMFPDWDSGLEKILSAIQAESIVDPSKIGESGAPHAEVVDYMIQALKDDDREVRIRASAFLEELGDAKAVDALISALKDDDPDVICSVASALGVLGDARAVDALTHSLKDNTDFGRVNVAWALGEIGDIRAVDALISTLKDKDTDVRSSAVAALGKLGDIRAVGALILILDDDIQKVRANAAWALGAIKDAKAVDALILALKDNDAHVRSYAAWALGEIGDIRAVDALTLALDDNNHEVLSDVKEALKMLSG
jgi:HEAT repeat protein